MLEEFAARRARGQARAARRRPAAVLRGRGSRRAVRPAGGERRRTAKTSTSASRARTASARPTRSRSSIRAAKEAFLEYDVARLVYNLANPKKTVVGLALERADRRRLRPADAAADAAVGRSSSRRGRCFEVRMLPRATLKIDDDINVLWIVHPAMLDDATQYAIDQFVMRGGRALIFVDPMAEILAARTRADRARGAAKLESRQAVQRLGRRVHRRATSSRTTATRSASGRASVRRAPRRPARPRHGRDEQGRRDHVGAGHGERRRRRATSSSPRARRASSRRCSSRAPRPRRYRSSASSSCPTRASS